VRRNRKKKHSTSARSLITKFDPKSPISEQYRTIRTNLQFASIDKEYKTIMVTSSNPAEGKSTTMANLAIVMAQQGKRVLLIDADLRKPSVHYTFKCPNTKGLTSVLTKQAYLEEAVYHSDVPNLDLLPSGPIPPNPSELLGSLAMERLLSGQNDTYDIILVDAPPILVVTDAQVLANICEGVILVVSSGKTEIEQVVKAKGLLEMSKAKILGVVLNGKETKQSQYYYYYGK
jgi:capsular exopolysaccharide synthesis family protein